MKEGLLIGICLVILATLVGSVGSLSLKYISEHLGKNPFNLLKKPHTYIGIFFYGASVPIFVFALKFGELSTLYPFVGLSYVWVSLLSMKFLKERMNDYKWFGIILIITGAVLIGLGA